jgi:GMC oxidoreductase
LSGIGNPEVLAKIGVKPKVDLPNVGENVQEHIFTSLAFGTFFLPSALLTHPYHHTSRAQRSREVQHPGAYGRRNSSERSARALQVSCHVSREGMEFINRDDPYSSLRSCDKQNNSSEHKSLFSLSFLGIGTGSIARLSPNGEALTAAHVAHIRAAHPEKWKPGIAEQYTLQLDKLSADTASTSIVSMPVYTSRPSASKLLYQSFCPKVAR